MFKITAIIMTLSMAAGLFVGIHFPHVRRHQAEQEFYLRANCNHLNELCKLAEPRRKLSCLSIFTKGMEATDLALDNWLENFCFQKSDWTARETSVDLYKISELERKYVGLQDSVGRTFFLGNYKLASEFADAALSVWGFRQNHDACIEERFADDLLLLGRYADAKRVLERIQPLDQCPTERRNLLPYLVHRQQLMGQSLVGMHEYQAAKTVLERSIPGLTNEYDSKYSLDFYLGCAYLGLGDKHLAQKIFFQQPYKPDKIFEDTCLLRVGDSASARTVVLEAELICKKLENLDGVSELEFVSDILKINGFSQESKVVAAMVEKFKHHEGSLGGPAKP